MVSVSHRTAPIGVLEKVALSPDEAKHLIGLLGRSGIEAVVVATCNRTELYWLPARNQDSHAVSRAMTQVWREPPADFHRYALELEGGDAARHLFRVAAGLESLMLGESEILGQLRAAQELAEGEKSAGPLLTELFRAAVRFGRRARASTAIGQGAMSVASAAVHALKRAHPDLSETTVVVVGAGHTGFKAAQHLRAEGVGRLVVLNRTLARAEAAASRLGAECGPLDDLERHLADADAVVCAVQAPQPVLTEEMVRRAMAGRARPLVILDLSLPRAVAPGIENVPGASVIDLSRLEQAVMVSRTRREQEIPRVEEMLEEAFEEFRRAAAETAARPLVSELRLRAEAIRKAEVERAVAAGLGDAETLDHVTRRVVDRLLRAPSDALRRGLLEEQAQQASCLQCVFGVGERGAHDD
jgi:glutamyl-tRNA reductase